MKKNCIFSWFTYFIDKKWGFVDKNGKETIPLIYQNAYSFGEGLACVQLNNYWGFIDKSGSVVIPTMYDMAYSFQEGLALVSLNNKWGFVDLGKIRFI